jgi:hypothetical protein
MVEMTVNRMEYSMGLKMVETLEVNVVGLKEQKKDNNLVVYWEEESV